MNPRFLLAASAALFLASLVTLGITVRIARTRPATLPNPEPLVAAQPAVIEEPNGVIRSLLRRVHELEEQVKAGPGAKPAEVVVVTPEPSPEPVLPEVQPPYRDHIPELLARKDADKLLLALLELAGFGSGSYPEALSLMSKLLDRENEIYMNPSEFEVAMAGPLRDLARWAMTHPDSTPGNVRWEFVESFEDHQWMSDRELMDWIVAEKDRYVPAKLAVALEDGFGDELIPDLVRATRTYPEEMARETVYLLERLKTPAAMEMLRTLENDSDPAIRKEAKMQRLGDKSGATGIFVEFDGDIEASLGLQRGDIITGVDGRELETLSEWESEQARNKDSDEKVTLSYFRDGGSSSVRSLGKELARFDRGRFVRETK